MTFCYFCYQLFIRNTPPPVLPSEIAIYQLSDEEKSQLQTGDLIFRRGYGFVSTMILRMMREEYEVTHLGVVINRNDSLLVAHALSSKVSDQDGLRFQDLESFVKHSHDSTILVTRLKEIDHLQQQKILTQLEFYLQKQLPFDHKFDYRDTTEHYCSELIWRIYEHKLGILNVSDTLTFDEKYKSLEVFYDTSYFEIILDHHQ